MLDAIGGAGIAWVSVQRDARGVASDDQQSGQAEHAEHGGDDRADRGGGALGAIELRAVVLRGAGERAFIGGADIREMAGLDAGSARTFITLVHRSCDVFRRMPVPVIARIQGWALGAGLEVAAACDMRVAARGAVRHAGGAGRAALGRRGGAAAA